MWDLIVSVPDHCLSFYFTLPPDQTLVSIQDLCVCMPYLQALLSKSVKLMFSQYESGMTL